MGQIRLRNTFCCAAIRRALVFRVPASQITMVVGLMREGRKSRRIRTLLGPGAEGRRVADSTGRVQRMMTDPGSARIVSCFRVSDSDSGGVRG